MERKSSLFFSLLIIEAKADGPCGQQSAGEVIAIPKSFFLAFPLSLRESQGEGVNQKKFLATRIKISPDITRNADLQLSSLVVTLTSTVTAGGNRVLMLPFKRILCPTDFSEPALVALNRAEELARHFSAELIVAHAIPEMPGPHTYSDPPVATSFDVPLYQQELVIYAEKLLKELVSHQISPAVRTRDLVTTGEAAPEILRVAAQERVDLIVIASHGKTGWRRLVFGSVAEKVVRHAPCPVLTITAPPE
jgi:nucleotide-binding universal stress UspA family protein